ncbi:MAG: glycoside hydrolase family 10 protein, partial [Acidobacteriota bacterium]
LVERASANGITDLIVQVRGRGDAYYNSPFEPRAAELQDLPTEFDPLALVVKDAHAAGLRVHAWLNTYLVSDVSTLPASSAHLIYQHPEWLMVPRGLAEELFHKDPRQPGYLERLVAYARQNPRSLEGLFISPANPEVRQQLLRLWLDIATRYDVDGLHFDYVRYPSPEYDYSRVSLEQFRREIERTLPVEDRDFLGQKMEEEPLLQARTFPEQYAQFQRRQVNLLVERIYRQIKQVRPELKISAAVFANETDAVKSRFQDWKTWLRQGWLDAVCPMAYTPDTALFERQITTAISLAGGREVWSGIGAYRQAVGEVREKIELSRDLGAQGFILFSYNSLIETSPQNPRGAYLEELRDLILAPVE